MCQPPPPLPTNYIPRPRLLQAATDAILSSKCDATVGITLTLLGMGGFGKTTMAKALCHQPAIKRHFLDGFLWITLGQHPPNTEMKLNQLYDQLTCDKFKSNFSTADKLYGHVTNNLKRLLVVIDDVWYANDAKIYAEVFNTCKIILTTRKNDVVSQISTAKAIKVEEMDVDEAVQLLTNNVIDINETSSSEKRTLEDLATDLHKWPILLSLVRNQLCLHVQMQSSFRQALHKVKQTLYSKGLTAFDDSHGSRESAVKASVDATLDLLTASELSNIQAIVLYAGFGVYIPKSLLHQIWDGDVENNIQKLWSCGLITLTKLVLAPCKAQLQCVEMHAVIAQYLVDKIDHGTLQQIVVNFGVTNIKSANWLLNAQEEDCFEFESEDDIPDDSENAFFQIQFHLGFMDNLSIPFVIQKLVVATKIMQQNIAEQIKLLSEKFRHSHGHLCKLLSEFEKNNDALNSAAGSAYQHFVKFYKEIKPLLTFDSFNYSNMVLQLKAFLKDHPIGKLESKYSKLLQRLVLECNEDGDAIAFIHQNTAFNSKQGSGVQSFLPILERQIKNRYKLITLLNSNLTLTTYLETVMDIMFDDFQFLSDMVVDQMSTDYLTFMQSIDTADNEIKPLFDALAKLLSERFYRDPQSKPLLAIHFNIDQTLPPKKFVFAILRSYFQSIPRAH